MRIAVLADIHGYSPALETVLDDIGRSQIDQIVVAGDLFEGGPDPNGVIRLLKEQDCRCVYGNTDRNLVDAERFRSEGYTWARQQLGNTGLDFLRALPFSVRIPHPAAPGDSRRDLLVVHANPTDVDRHLSPNASEREIAEIIGDEPAETIAVGHLHIAYVRCVGEKTLVDVSAVGTPRDGDLRPRYVIFEPDDTHRGRWSHEFKYLDYPIEATEHLMRTSGMPKWEKAFHRLLSARYDRPI